MKEDSLQLVDYWSIDFDYNGVACRPKLSFCRDNDGIGLSCESLAEGFDRIGIRCIDIFGNSSFHAIDLKGE